MTTFSKPAGSGSAPNLGTLSGAEAKAFYLGLDAVIFGYPAVKFEQLMRERAQPGASSKGDPQSAVNQFGLVNELRGPEFKLSATPNNDVLHAQAFCDVSREPLILSVPQFDDARYYCLQLWDPNGETFGYVGSRTTGREAARYALVGPHWSGDLPRDVQRIDAPYNGFAIWGRIGVNGRADLPAARALQAELRLTPLSTFDASSTNVSVDLDFSRMRVSTDFPAEVPADLLFFYELARAIQYTPPKDQDAVVAQSLAAIGFTPDGKAFDHTALSQAQQDGLTKAYQLGMHLMDVSAASAAANANGWRFIPKSGESGDDYLFRAAFAKWYTGKSTLREAIYLDARNDDQGAAFEGSKRYTMHFDASALPQVSAFWSLSIYNLNDGSLVPNAIERYSIGDRTMGLVTNADGSLDLYLQADEPTGATQRANWLPTPPAGFYLNLRLYGPGDGLQSGTWAPPQVKVSADS